MFWYFWATDIFCPVFIIAPLLSLSLLYLISCLITVCLQEGELEFEAELAKSDKAAHSETLRDAAPVIEGIKVMCPNIQNMLNSPYKCIYI